MRNDNLIDDTPAPQLANGVGIGRMIAALAVVWIHIPDERTNVTLISRFAVPFFACACGYFALVGGRQLSLKLWFFKRFQRLYLPFFAWTVLYLGFVVGGSWLLTDQIPTFSWLNVLINGSVHHLWFLPFALIAGTLIRVIRLLFSRGSHKERQRLSTPTMFLLLLGAVMAILTRKALGPYSSYLIALAFDHMPAALWGGALGCLFVTAGELHTWSRRIRWPIAISLVLGLVTLLITGRHVLIENMTGVSFFLFCAGLTPSPFFRSRFLNGEIAMGVYLVHILFLEAAQDILRIPFPNLNSVPIMLLLYVFTILASITATIVLRANRYTRWLS